MRILVAALTSVVVLSLSLVACTGCPLAPPGAPAAQVPQVELRGELCYCRHIDPVTGRGAVALRADGKNTWLDLRAFHSDHPLSGGPYVIKGHWGQQHRLIVTVALPSGHK